MQQKLERYLQLCGNMIVPFCLYSLTLLLFLWCVNWNYEQGVIFHRIFLVADIIILLVLLNFNRGYLLFISGIIFIAYIGINYLKKNYGTEMILSPYYQNITVLLPLNMMFFYFRPSRFFTSASSLFYLIGISFEYGLFEFLSRQGYALNYDFYHINIFAVVAFGLLILVSFIQSVRTGSLYDYGMLFISLSVMSAIYFSVNPVGLSLFFLNSALIILFITIYQLVYNFYYDELTKLLNRRSYMRQSKSFSPKYSLGIVSIDGYDGLSKGLSIKQKNELITLFVNIMQNSLPEDTLCYRYDDNKFIVVSEKNELKEFRTYLEDIRRFIAGVEFVLQGHSQPLKITISGGIAEKKRVDADADAVLSRAYKLMSETLKFTGNVISPIPRNERR